MSKGSCGRTCVACLACALLLVSAASGLTNAAAETRQREVARLVRSAPSGSGDARADWLYDQARRMPDALLAFSVMEEVARRSSAPAADRARLWMVRFWMAGGKTERAAEVLQSVSAQHPELAGEIGFWKQILGGSGALADRRSTGLPPWEALAQIAALGESGREGGEAQVALSLEGTARRLGLLGPWLWRLQRSGDAGLRRAARAAVGWARAQLAVSPEGPALEAALESREPDRRSRAEQRPGVPAAEPARRPGQGFAVQIGAFREQTAAQQLASELSSHRYAAFLMPSTDDDVIRVCLGPCSSRAEAESLAARVSAELMLTTEIIEAR